ncbi:hypothetical protein IE53DRAFT_39650 [Violaceomyces palustris]|uniref:Uncharacterized protein n=1 Tax=Violaceomyces palustris TaxID=1673888 RepID=A0ACD0P122_9BASI|nr:hypothetical protein IE53DRAFT_39650 [Violaceomyces palustris]
MKKGVRWRGGYEDPSNALQTVAESPLGPPPPSSSHSSLVEESSHSHTLPGSNRCCCEAYTWSSALESTAEHSIGTEPYPKGRAPSLPPTTRTDSFLHRHSNLPEYPSSPLSASPPVQPKPPSRLDPDGSRLGRAGVKGVEKSSC